MLILLLLLFPTGELPSPRWRPVAFLVLVLAGVFIVASSIIQLAIWNDPFANTDRVDAEGAREVRVRSLSGVAFLGLPVLLVVALISVIVRYRRSRGDERLQLKWFAFAAVFVVVTFVVSGSGNAVWNLLSALALLGLWVAIGIAMLRYRLYDIDVVIRKTLVGGVLVAFVTMVYAAIVAGIGALGSSVGALDRGPLIALATAIVAIAAQPVLRRARHLANRLVYGDRATPYEVLSEFSERMGETYSTDEVPLRMARILAEGTGATRGDGVAARRRPAPSGRDLAGRRSAARPRRGPGRRRRAVGRRRARRSRSATRASCSAPCRSRCRRTSRCLLRRSGSAPTWRPRPGSCSATSG